MWPRAWQPTCTITDTKEKQVSGFKQILFPVDFSEQNRAMAPHVACMASRYSARVTMLHVLEIPTGVYPGWPDYSGLLDITAMLDIRKQKLHAFLKSEFETIATTRLIVEGAPGQVISEYAAKENVDLIMMPTHGYGPFRRFLLGSVTAKTLHDADCPVWTSAHMLETPAPFTGYHACCARWILRKAACLYCNGLTSSRANDEPH